MYVRWRYFATMVINGYSLPYVINTMCVMGVNNVMLFTEDSMFVFTNT